MKPQFTIITVCRNEESHIRRTCESITSQSHENWEWIVIDGKSTDSTVRILEEYEDSITCLVSESDDGIYHAMNKGVARASGQYLVFMNGGDAFASSKVLEWVAAEATADLLYGDAHHDSIDGPLKTYPNRLQPGYFLTQQIPHQATYYRRQLFEKYGHYDISYAIAADYELNVRLLEVAKISHHHIKKPLAIYSQGGISSDPKHRSLRKRENHEVRMKYFPRYRWSLKAWRQIARQLLRCS